jgi:hypothetical protein
MNIIDLTVDVPECTPVRTDATDVDSAEIVSLLKEVKVLSQVPPVKPRGGTLFQYDLGDDPSTWEATKKKLRY